MQTGLPHLTGKREHVGIKPPIEQHRGVEFVLGGVGLALLQRALEAAEELQEDRHRSVIHRDRHGTASPCWYCGGRDLNLARQGREAAGDAIACGAYYPAPIAPMPGESHADSARREGCDPRGSGRILLSPRWRPLCRDGGAVHRGGIWETAFGKAEGRAAIADLARAIRAREGEERPRAIHLVTNIIIALAGDHARVRSNWTVVQNSPAGPRIGSGGGYEDEMVKQDGRWLFRCRKIDRFSAG